MLRALGKWIRRRRGWIGIDDIDQALDLEWSIKWREVENPITFQGTTTEIGVALLTIRDDLGEIPEHLSVKLPDGKVARVW
jgi:hypothetical protein